MRVEFRVTERPFRDMNRWRGGTAYGGEPGWRKCDSRIVAGAGPR